LPMLPILPGLNCQKSLTLEHKFSILDLLERDVRLCSTNVVDFKELLPVLH
jgi:hypothetical protein